MKTFVHLCFIAGLSALPITAFSQDADSTGLPGDNFDLQGALELFKKAPTPEAFEKALNLRDNHVNNLDLNGDDKIDYIQVVDKADGKNHAIVLRTAVKKNETQDIAVIVLEQTGDKKAQLQIIGKADMYGEETIVEPYDEAPDKKSTGPSSLPAPMHVVFVNVWSWPCVSYIYSPGYVLYASPWGWELYPSWWYPWEPYWWHVHYGYAYHYHHMMYHYTNTCYMQQAHNVYVHHRSTSPTVAARYERPRANYEAGRAQGGNKPRTAQPSDRKVAPRSGEKQQVASPPKKETGRQGTNAGKETPKIEQRPAPRPQQRTAEPRNSRPQRVAPPPQQRTTPAPQRRATPAPQRQGNPGGGGHRR
jgi:hypothetical protein